MKRTGNDFLAVITVARDNPEELALTIESVSNQDSPVDRHIILDSSSQNLMQDMRSISASFSAEYHWREANGIYPAMKDAVDLLEDSGYCLFLNSGDYLHSTGAVSIIRSQLEVLDGKAWLIGGIYIETGDGEKITYEIPTDQGEFSKQLLAGKIWLPHPATVYQVSALKSIGPFRDNLKIASDYATGLRLFKQFGAPRLVPDSLATFVSGGVSSTSGPRPALENSIARVKILGLRKIPQELFITSRVLLGWLRRRLFGNKP